MDTLKFDKPNAKLKNLQAKIGKKVYSLSLLSGWTCPGANLCHSKAIEIDGSLQIQDGKNTQFRCYSASQEAQYRQVYDKRKYNTNLIKQCKSSKEILDLFQQSLPLDAKVIRWQASGDFMNYNHMFAAFELAKNQSNMHFYAYTKSIPYWLSILNKQDWPSNFVITASRGGRWDDLIEQHSLKNVTVVYSHDEAKKLKLKIDHDDSLAMQPEPKSYALLLHGQMPAGSEASKARQKLIQLGFKGYSK